MYILLYVIYTYTYIYIYISIFPIGYSLLVDDIVLLYATTAHNTLVACHIASKGPDPGSISTADWCLVLDTPPFREARLKRFVG